MIGQYNSRVTSVTPLTTLDEDKTTGDNSDNNNKPLRTKITTNQSRKTLLLFDTHPT